MSAIDSLPNFWNENHPLFEAYDKFWQEMIPPQGNAATLQGELLRAAGKISYDWFNNGWGCNNWSGAVVFLKEYASVLPNRLPEEEMHAFHDALNNVKRYSHGEPVPTHPGDDDEHTALVTIIMEKVIKLLIQNPSLIPSSYDMYNYQEPQYYDDEQDDQYEWAY